MRDPFIKRVELAIRRWIIRTLRHFARPAVSVPIHLQYQRAKFLFVRQDMIGDVLISTPLFAALKSHYPGTVIDALLSPQNDFVLEHDPAIRRRWIYTKGPFSTFTLIRKIRSERYDFLVDLMDNPSATSTLLTLLSGARWTVGLEKENAYAYDISMPLLSRRDSHIVDRIARLLIPFGIDPERENLAIRYFTSSDAEQFADDFLKVKELAGRFVIGVNLSAGTDVRFWGERNFISFLSALHGSRPEDPVLLLYKPSDEGRARRIRDAAPWCTLSPRTPSFDHFAALVRHLAVLVTPDTSAVHLASAFQIPSVVLYVQSNKELRIWDPYRTPCESIVTEMDNLSIIDPAEVLHAIERLLARVGKESPAHSVS